jgi:hypothetical protein
MNDCLVSVQLPHLTFPISSSHNIHLRQRPQTRTYFHHVKANFLLHATAKPIRSSSFSVLNWNTNDAVTLKSMCEDTIAVLRLEQLPAHEFVLLRVSSSVIWRRVVCWVATDVSEEHIASIFRVEEIISARTSKQVEADTLHNHRCENLKFYTISFIVCALFNDAVSSYIVQRRMVEW